ELRRREHRDPVRAHGAGRRRRCGALRDHGGDVPVSLRVAALALAVLAAVPSYAGPARAQGSESASLVGAARGLYREGVRAGGEGRWEDARSAFERSYELAPRVATLLNLAVALEHLGRFVEAIDAYRRFLARADEATLRERGEAAHAAI